MLGCKYLYTTRALVQTNETSVKQDAYDSITVAYLAICPDLRDFDRLQVAFITLIKVNNIPEIDVEITFKCCLSGLICDL